MITDDHCGHSRCLLEEIKGVWVLVSGGSGHVGGGGRFTRVRGTDLLVHRKQCKTR